MLSLGQGVFFGFGAYCMGMYLTLHNRDGKCLWQRAPGLHGLDAGERTAVLLVSLQEFSGCRRGGHSGAGVLRALFGFLAFRSRIKGVYFAIITQALAFAAWLVFNRNETQLGGTNGLTDFKQVLGFRLSDPSTQRVLYILTVLCLGAPTCSAAGLSPRGPARS